MTILNWTTEYDNSVAVSVVLSVVQLRSLLKEHQFMFLLFFDCRNRESCFVEVASTVFLSLQDIYTLSLKRTYKSSKIRYLW